jgi:hypothetical protein
LAAKNISKVPVTNDDDDDDDDDDLTFFQTAATPTAKPVSLK